MSALRVGRHYVHTSENERQRAPCGSTSRNISQGRRLQIVHYLPPFSDPFFSSPHFCLPKPYGAKMWSSNPLVFFSIQPIVCLNLLIFHPLRIHITESTPWTWDHWAACAWFSLINIFWMSGIGFSIANCRYNNSVWKYLIVANTCAVQTSWVSLRVILSFNYFLFGFY